MRAVPFLRVSFLRKALSVMVILDLVTFVWFLADARGAALDSGRTLNWFADWASRPTLTALVAAIGTIAALLFARRPGRILEGVVALAALVFLSTAHAQVFGSPWRHMYFSGLSLLGWLAGLEISRRQGVPSDESYACTGTIALLGAAYLNGGVSKVVYGGVQWMSGLPIRALVVGQDGLVQDGVASMYRSWVATTPGVAAAFSVLTIIVELAGPLMIAGPRARRLVAMGLIVMHTNIYILTGILYIQSIALLALFGMVSDADLEDAPARVAPPVLHNRTFFRVAVLLAFCAVLAITHQGRRYGQLHGPTPIPIRAPAPAIEAPGAVPPAHPPDP